MSFDAAVAELYAAFAPQPRPDRIEYCSCRWTAEEERELLGAGPLRDIPAGLLRS